MAQATEPSRQKPILVAVAGNPNSGKTTIFNNLTGTRQHVGNYPGVTVEKKEGRFRHAGREVRVVDLPGTYSLTAYTLEEVIARREVIHEKPDLVLDVLDASNLERNLYLATQFMELGVPLVLAFNMSDLAESRGYRIDADLLSRLLGVAIVRTVGHKGTGTDALKDAIVAVGSAPSPPTPSRVTYGEEIERELSPIAEGLAEDPALADTFNPRWLAVKLLEGDEEVQRQVSEAVGEDAFVLRRVESARGRIERHFGDAPEIILADRRYGFISGACQEAVRTTVESRHTWSDRIDAVVTNRVLGLPIFLVLMYLVFKVTFTLGGPPMEWIEAGFGWLGEAVASLWPAGSESALKSLMVDGVIGGVGGVVVFLPNILILFLAIAVLEDSGYMARAAFIMDRLMHKIGLHGKSFIPMLIGFGCTVPAILATRTLESRRDRLTTMMVLPLMSCGARLPIYALFIPAFFEDTTLLHLGPLQLTMHAALLMLIYLIGIVLAVVLAKALRATLFKGESMPFVMELPPYRMPTVRGTLTHTWERGWLFLRKAGTVIVAISILLWVLTSYPKPTQDHLAGLDEREQAQTALSHSVAGRVGHALEPVMRPAGFDWKTTTALLGAFAAKEVFVAQLGIVHALGEADEDSEPLRAVLQREYTPLQGFAIMLFCLISIPCMVTVITTWKESGSWKWAALQVVGLTVLAWLLTTAFYQIGLLVGVGMG